ncbi:MAG TPA: hypothetical protein VNK70_02655 [Candidatus Paceibacterota bacterium]|nr:hypothetical protein [Candidatus Paceibacterota bacterium]
MGWGRKLVVLGVILVLGLGLFGLFREKRRLGGEVEKMRKSLNALENENRDLAAKIEFFKNPENLVKEIKSQFNYREKGEELIIIVPGATGTGE